MKNPSTVVKLIFDLCKAVSSRLEQISENSEVCQRIQKQVKSLEGFANKLKIDKLPKPYILFYTEEFKDSLENCKEYCASLDKCGNAKRFIKTNEQKKQLEALESELSRARSNLQLALHQVSVQQGTQIEEAVQEGKEETIRAVVNPLEGVYLPNGRAVDSIPCKLEKPQVSLDKSRDCMKISWQDYKNTVDRYEIRYDDEKQLIVSPHRDECILHKGQNILGLVGFCALLLLTIGEWGSWEITFLVVVLGGIIVLCSSERSIDYQIMLGPPKVTPGGIYTIQVRGKNGAGAGQWSEAKIFRFKIGPPSKPRKPTVTVLSPTKIRITTKRSSEREENGSCVTVCKVEYTELNGDSSTWKSDEKDIEQEDINIDIKGLNPDTTYCVRIKMINSVGESHPSDSCEVTTTQQIPGPPQNLRISTRKDTCIELQWEKPAENPQAVACYKVQKRQSKKSSEWSDLTTIEIKYFKFEGLRTKTRYEFRVRSVNNKGEAGMWSDSIEAETRYGLLGRAVGTAGAFIGGTLGGPLLGGYAFGEMASNNASKAYAGKKLAIIGAGAGGAVAGGLLGIVAAPIFGITCALMAKDEL